MLAAATLRDNLAGAWAVMNGRPQGLRRLDTTIDGFWRSFSAVVLVVPLALVAVAVAPGALPEEGAAPARLADGLFRRALGLGVDFVAFPLVLALLARPLGLARTYVPFIVARNWGSVIVAAMFGAAALPALFGLVSPEVLSLLLFVVFGVSLRFSYLVARTALAVPPLVAVPIVLLELVLSLLIEISLDRLA